MNENWVVLYTKEGTVVMPVTRYCSIFRRADPLQVCQYKSLETAVLCGRDLSGIVPDAIWIEEDRNSVRRDLTQYLSWIGG